MSYRSIHKANENFGLAVMWVLIVAFLLAMVLMFVHPGGTLLLVWTGIIVVLAAVVITRLFRRAEESAARTALETHHCPSCGAEVHREPQHEDEWECDSCGAVFAETGTLRGEPTQ